MCRMHIENLELMQLRLLEAIAAKGSLSAAAAEVGLSQSAASHSLARLRKEAGDLLFVRTASRMQPTAYGEQLVGATRSALSLLREGLRDRRQFNAAESRRTFTLYMSEAGQLALLPSLLAYLWETAPGVRLRISRIPDQRPGEPLEVGEVDLAIGHIATLTTGFHRRRLFHERYACLACSDNRAFQDGMSIDAYKQASHAIADASGMAHWLIDQQLEPHRIVRKVGLVVPEFLALPFVIPRSELVATLPARVARRFAEFLPLRMMDPPVPFEAYEIFMLWHERAHIDPANLWLRNVVVRLFTEAAPGAAAGADLRD